MIWWTLTRLTSAETGSIPACAINDAVYGFVNQLAVLDRRLIELRLEGYSTADAARRLNEDPDQLRVRLNQLQHQVRGFRAVRRLALVVQSSKVNWLATHLRTNPSMCP